MGEIVESLLQASLEVAVPLWIEKFRDLSCAERHAIADQSAQMVAAHGADLLFKSPGRGGTAAVFNALARGLAVAAFAPGGVTFLGVKFIAHSKEDPDGSRSRSGTP